MGSTACAGPSETQLEPIRARVDLKGFGLDPLVVHTKVTRHDETLESPPAERMKIEWFEDPNRVDPNRVEQIWSESLLLSDTRSEGVSRGGRRRRSVSFTSLRAVRLQLEQVVATRQGVIRGRVSIGAGCH